MLLRDAGDKGYVQCLSGIVDTVVHGLVKDESGDRLTRHLLRLEREIRVALAGGARGSLSKVWDEAAARLMKHGDELLKDSLTRARRALKVDGELADCDKSMPAGLLMRAWTVVQDRKTRKLSEDLRRLAISLSNILEADAARSAAGRSADSLKAAIGTGHAEVFDFAALSRVLSSTAAREAPARQPPPPDRSVAVGAEIPALPAGAGRRRAPRLHERCYSFTFDSCADALAAYRERLPKADGARPGHRHRRTRSRRRVQGSQARCAVRGVRRGQPGPG